MAGTLHLDTNVLIFGLDPNHPMREQLRRWRAQEEPIAVSAMAWAEFRCGPVSSASLLAWGQMLGRAVIPVDRIIAERASSLFNLSGRRSRSLPDCLIAATALERGARLATLNPEDFKPLQAHGLVLV